MENVVVALGSGTQPILRKENGRGRASPPRLVRKRGSGNLLVSSRYGMGVPVRETLSHDEVARAIAGDEPSIRLIVDCLTPVIQGRAARLLLLRRPWGENREIRQEVEDLTQEVLLALFVDDAKVLRDWQPARGLVLERFVALVADRRITSVLRSRRRNPWHERPTEMETFERTQTAPDDPAQEAETRQLYRRILDRLRLELSPLGWHLFDLFFLQELPFAEVRKRANLSAAAAYAWRSRLRKAAKRLAAELESSEPVKETKHG